MKILGFDLGDGESAVALLDGESTVEPRMLPLVGRVSILSAGGTRDGRIVVGEDANVLSGAQDARVRFKSRYLTDPDAPAAVRAFAQGVMAEIMRAEPALMAEVSRTVVGCPAGWGDGRREQYAALMESAGFPNVCIVPEPRAAFLYARHARGLRVDPALMQASAVVIDIGSSTTDFAYIVDGHQQNLSLFGDTNLGGGVLDELILNRSVKESPDRRELERVFAESPAWRSYCELEARRLKERYFADEQKWQEESLCAPLVVCYDKTLMLELRLNAEIVGDIVRQSVAALGGRSFIGCLDDALRAAKEVSRACPPQVVILTGGASRMAFFREACREAFSDALLVLCPEPECSIARGLAYAGRVDERLAVFRREVASIAKGERLSAAVNASVYTLYRPLAGVLYEAAVESAVSAVGLWRRGGVPTIEELDGVLEEDFRRALLSGDVQARIRGPVSAWADELMHTLEGELSELCVRCGVPPEKMSLGATKIDAQLSGVRIPLTDAMGMDVVSGLLGVVLAAVGASVCGGGGVALVAAGPLGVVAGAAAGVLLALLGKSGVEKAMRKAKLPGFMRLLVTDGAVRRGLARHREEIERSIVTALCDPSNGMSAKLTQSLSLTLGEQMERMARRAEMSICA
ncbi:MAG: Hsp70 family protein [Clostridia bacterium]|nr:Hsp70 family protein [Clostridia bacterium]